MPEIRVSHELRWITYIVRAAMLLGVLTEAYTFTNPESYIEFWKYPMEDRHFLIMLKYAYTLATASVVDIFVRIYRLWSNTHYTLLMFSITSLIADINTPQELGVAICFTLPTRVIAFRWAIR